MPAWPGCVFSTLLFPFVKGLFSWLTYTLSFFSPQVRFGQIKRKLGLDGSDSPSKATPKSDGDVPSVPTTPTKIRKPRGSGAARGKAAAAKSGGGGGGGAGRRARSKTATLEPEDHLTLEKDDEDDLGMPLYGVKKEEELEDGSLL